MKAGNLFIVLLLVSNLTLSSGFLDVLAAVASYVVHTFIERDDLLPFDPKRLEADLRDSLFGQHIASDVVLKAVTSFMTDKNPNKPLVLSFHGTSGVGKNHVAKIIAQLKQWIYKSVSSFPRSMFIFDQMDKTVQPQLIDTIKPFLNARVNGVSFHNAIFIFLSNEGGNMIANWTLDSWREGICREELWMNSKELETKISQDSGFLHSIIDHHLVDHYIPFLPLMLRHVRQCVLAEMIHLKITRDIDLADKVAREMLFFPEREEIFSFKGCKSVRQKLVLYQF